MVSTRARRALVDKSLTKLDHTFQTNVGFARSGKHERGQSCGLIATKRDVSAGIAYDPHACRMESKLETTACVADAGFTHLAPERRRSRIAGTRRFHLTKRAGGRIMTTPRRMRASRGLLH